MFNNFINRYDIYRILKKVKHKQLLPALKKVFSTQKNRVKATWSDSHASTEALWQLPLYNQRINRFISGNKEINHCEYITGKYFSSSSELHALSLGCGSGQNELRWAEMKIFKQIDAFDISDSRIAYAREQAGKKAVSDIIQYNVADVSVLDLGIECYDLIFFEGSLHHFSSLTELLQRVKIALKPIGYLLVKDFVGPRRFQWSDRQLKLTNAFLAILPHKYRVKWGGSGIKKMVFRPSKLSMILNDPSEAVESDQILPVLNQYFELVELKKLGGTIILLLLGDIAHNFVKEDPESQSWLKFCFDTEEFLIQQNQIPSDLIMGIFKKGKV